MIQNKTLEYKMRTPKTSNLHTYIKKKTDYFKKLTVSSFNIIVLIFQKGIKENAFPAANY